jgi:peroxiredoxin
MLFRRASAKKVQVLRQPEDDSGGNLMSLESQLAALKTSAQVPDPVAVSDLLATEARSRPLKVGDRVPTFTLRAYEGISVSSSDYLDLGPLVITFYRGLWCPYCQGDLQSFDEAFDRIRDLGASFLAISRPRQPGLDMPADHGLHLRFPILEDVTGTVAVQFGIRWSPDDIQLIEEVFGHDIGNFRDAEPWITPMQARFVIDRDGMIARSEIAFDYRQKSDPTDLMSILTDLQRQR